MSGSYNERQAEAFFKKVEGIPLVITDPRGVLATEYYYYIPNYISADYKKMLSTRLDIDTDVVLDKYFEVLVDRGFELYNDSRWAYAYEYVPKFRALKEIEDWLYAD